MFLLVEQDGINTYFVGMGVSQGDTRTEDAIASSITATAY